ncbi:MAG: hypothetical protein V5A55_14485 [Halovenus sp.]
MVEADPVMRAARNGFLVLILVLLLLSVYRFVFVDEGGLMVPALWTLGVAVFYASRYYYRRQDDS